MKRIIPVLLFTLFFACSGWAQAKINRASNFKVTDIDGQKHQLFEYLNDGKYVLIDFFFTTCRACAAAMPTLHKAYEQYGCNTGEVVFLGIDVGNTDAEVRRFEEKYGHFYPLVSGQNGGGNKVIADYGIPAYPTTLLIAPNRSFVSKDIWPVNQANLNRAILQLAGIAPSACPSSVGHFPERGNIEFSIFPNPVVNHATLNIAVAHSMQVTVNIINILGQTVETPIDSILSEPTSKFVEFEHLKPGLYLMQLIADGKVISTQRFSKVTP